jgi:hypothetical protein
MKDSSEWVIGKTAVLFPQVLAQSQQTPTSAQVTDETWYGDVQLSANRNKPDFLIFLKMPISV